MRQSFNISPSQKNKKAVINSQPTGSEQMFSSAQMCSRGGGGRKSSGACVYLYKKDPLKKWFAQGLPGTARYIRKANRLFLSLIDGIVGYTYNSLIVFPCTIRSQFMVVNL